MKLEASSYIPPKTVREGASRSGDGVMHCHGPRASYQVKTLSKIAFDFRLHPSIHTNEQWD